MIEKYIDAISNGKTNGYGFIRELNSKQIAILCSIINAITNNNYRYHAGVMIFTDVHSQIGDPLWDRYVRNVQLAADDLIEVEGR